MGPIKTSAKDFFLHLGTIVALYTVTVSFLNLIFKVVNKTFPEVGQNIYAWGSGSEISLPVATLIVVFPIFLVLSYFVQKIYITEPAKKELAIRKWLTYITLFVAGILLAGDLVTVLYKFLDGQDLTAAFLFKALAVLVVAGLIFIHYLQDIRDKVSARCHKTRPVIASVVILAAIIWGFVALGSPKTQRLVKYDNQKITDLQNIQWQVISYWQINGRLPLSLDEIISESPYNIIPKDPQSQVSYDYKIISNTDLTFELCAQFNRENKTQNQYLYTTMPIAKYTTQNENWNHGVGKQCFKRVIDPTVYPTQVKG